MRALRAINNLLAKAAISLAMFIVFLMVAALALSAQQDLLQVQDLRGLLNYHL